ncbi:MAG: SMP-30/Gluconolaconase/LRE domain protein [Myxococcaceae bacterium]|nr:SMP-30/Gluconolaconase/LRE domain protein [Myxococcaceae bacterium]
MRPQRVWPAAFLFLTCACSPQAVRHPWPDEEVDLDAGGLPASGAIGADAGLAGDAGARSDPSAMGHAGTMTDAALRDALDARGPVHDGGVVSASDLHDGAVAALGAPDAMLAMPDAAGLTTCADGLPRGAKTGAQTQLFEHAPTMEGVAVCADGEAFVSAASNSEIWHVPLAGSQPERWAKIEGRLFAGVTCDARGRLFVADFGVLGSNVPRGVVLFDHKGATGLALPAPSDGTVFSSPNGIVAVAERGIYVSDTTLGLIVLYREQEGVWQGTTVARDLAGANGLAYSRKDRRLYVALSNFMGGDNAIVSFAIGGDGALSDRKTAWTGPEVVDGVAVDEGGALYVAHYDAGRVVRVDDGATVATATNPASLAFRGGALLFTDYDVVGSVLEAVLGQVLTTGRLDSVQLGVCGGQ